MGNYSLELRGRALSQTQRSGLQVQATLDGREKIWLGGTVEGRCLHTTAGHMNGKHRISHINAKNIKPTIARNVSVTVQVRASVRISLQWHVWE